ncbi:hypothetical protein Lser_V15G29985 [Lactuca serriola]
MDSAPLMLNGNGGDSDKIIIDTDPGIESKQEKTLTSHAKAFKATENKTHQQLSQYLYVHTDLHGASSTVIKNHKPDNSIPPLTLNQAGSFTVSNTTATGEYLPGYGNIFWLHETSLGSHMNERRVRGEEDGINDSEDSEPFKELFDSERFWLNKNGEHCETISAAECLIPIRTVSEYYYQRTKPRFIESSCRFAVNGHQPLCMEFKTHVRPQFLSQYITYTVNLVFQLKYTDYLGLCYRLAGETKSWTSYLVEKREDGCLMAELYQFTSDNRNVDHEITFLSEEPLIVEGIAFLPLERVEQEVVGDEEIDMQTISDSDTYWEEKLPRDYEDIIKTSKDSLQWTTKKDLYSVLCKGFPINDGDQWFSLAKDGKKCYMLPASVALNKGQWSWRSLPESRFGVVAYSPRVNFSIYCLFRMPSPQKTYAVYLVYKLQAYHSRFELPLKVSYGHHSWYIYLLCPQLPIIRGKLNQNTYNPLKRRKMKGIPQKRNDGWMEVIIWEFQTTMDVEVWEFQTSSTSEKILMDCGLNLSANESLEGLILQGIEFKQMN